MEVGSAARSILGNFRTETGPVMAGPEVQSSTTPQDFVRGTSAAVGVRE